MADLDAVKDSVERVRRGLQGGMLDADASRDALTTLCDALAAVIADLEEIKRRTAPPQ